MEMGLRPSSPNPGSGSSQLLNILSDVRESHLLLATPPLGCTCWILQICLWPQQGGAADPEVGHKGSL